MNGINEHGSFGKKTCNMMFDKVCQSIVLQNSMFSLLQKISAFGLQSAMKILFFFDLLLRVSVGYPARLRKPKNARQICK